MTEPNTDLRALAECTCSDCNGLPPICSVHFPDDEDHATILALTTKDTPHEMP